MSFPNSALPYHDLAEPDLPETGAEIGNLASKRLARLRQAALACRAAPRLNVMGAASPYLFAEPPCHSLIQTLHAALPARAVFYRPEEATRSFDEAWLLRLLQALETEDWDSVTFLLRSRLKPHLRTTVLALCNGLMAEADRI